MTREQHAEARGEVLMEIEMTPGDVLYIPHGQYHDAIATSEASLHITFGVRHMAVQDFLNRLLPDLSGDPFFRGHLPAYDDAAGRQKTGEAVAARLAQVLADGNVLAGLRDFLQGKAFERESAFQFPSRGRAPTYRVRWPGRRLEKEGRACRLTGPDGACLAALDGAKADAAAWIYERDLFQLGELIRACPDLAPDVLEHTIGELERAGLLEQL